MLRPDNPLMPNYKWVPIGYHGRGSSIVVSGAVMSGTSPKAVVAAAPGSGLRRSAAALVVESIVIE